MGMTTQQMTVNKFIKISCCPIQRDTATRAKKALKNHLKEYSDTQRRVAIGKLGKSTYMIDGHTRAHLWENNQLERPSELEVDVYTVKTMEELFDLYKHFDSSSAVESTLDRMSGACRHFGIQFTSTNLLRNCGLKYAADFCLSGFTNRETCRLDELTLVEEFKREITWLAKEPFEHFKSGNKPGMPAVVTACVLIALRCDGNSALAFFEGYQLDSGTKTSSGCDGTFLAAQYIRDTRARDEIAGGRQLRWKQLFYLLNCYKAWKNNKRYKSITAMGLGYHKPTGYKSQVGDLMEEMGFKVKTLDLPSRKEEKSKGGRGKGIKKKGVNT